MEKGRTYTDLPSPVLPVRKTIQNQIGENLKSVTAEWENVDLVSAIQAVSSTVDQTLEIKHKVRVGSMRPGTHGKCEQEKVRNRVDDELSKLLLQDRSGDELGSVGTEFTHTLTRESLFLLRQPLGAGVGWSIWDDKESNDALTNCDGTGDDKKPLPSSDTVDAIHVAVEGSLQGSQEHGAGHIRDVEEGDSEGKLGWCVPVEDERDNTGPKDGRKESKEETQGIDGMRVGGFAGATLESVKYPHRSP